MKQEVDQSSRRESDPIQLAVTPVAAAPMHVGQTPQQAGATSTHRPSSGMKRTSQSRILVTVEV